jgi:hypothetical protein
MFIETFDTIIIHIMQFYSDYNKAILQFQESEKQFNPRPIYNYGMLSTVSHIYAYNIRITTAKDRTGGGCKI